MTERPVLEATIEVRAIPAEAWRVVGDPVAIGQASPQVVRTLVRGGSPTRPGTRMYNLNHRGILFWPTRAIVVEADPGRRLAFRITDNWAIWSYTLEPTAIGTRIVHRRETPEGISPLSRTLTQAFLGGEDSFADELVAGMNRTLRRLKARIESA